MRSQDYPMVPVYTDVDTAHAVLEARKAEAYEEITVGEDERCTRCQARILFDRKDQPFPHACWAGRSWAVTPTTWAPWSHLPS